LREIIKEARVRGSEITLTYRIPTQPKRALSEISAVIRQRVNAARAIQLQRFHKRNLHANARMGAREMRRYCTVNEQAEKLLETAINKLGLSARAYSRVLKVARTIADLAGSADIESAHIAEAIQYRSLGRRT
jgi:magnesium chelatase family protein